MGLNAEMLSTLSSNLLENNGNKSNKFIETINDNLPYVNLAISKLPLWKDFIKYFEKDLRDDFQHNM